MNQRHLPLASAMVLLVAGLMANTSFSRNTEALGTPAAPDYEIVPARPEGFPAILYYCLNKRIVLADDEVSRVLASVEQAVPRHTQVWFLEVHTSPLSETTLFPEFEVFITTYFEPTLKATPVKHGRALDLRLHGKSRNQYEIAVRGEYEYVQLPGPAGRSDRGLAVPIPRNLPFRAPPGVGDAALVSIVECARDAARATDSRTLADGAPASISPSEGGNFDAYLGHGGGVVVTCKPRGDGYVKVGDIRYWMAP